MKNIFLLLLLLLTACAKKTGVSSPVPTRTVTETIQVATPTLTGTFAPDAYPYPAVEPPLQLPPYPVMQPSVGTTPYPAPLDAPAPNLGPTMTPTRTFTPTISPMATAILPTATFPPSLSSLRIAFTSVNKIYLWDKGKTELVAEVEEATNFIKISSDGEVIAFKLSTGLWAINADGTGKRLLVGSDRLQVVNPMLPESKSLLS